MFIEEMNKAFASGARCVTLYRNTKNIDTNFISSAYGIHFYNNTVEKHRPRSLLRVGTHLTGAGYLIKSSLLAGSRHYTNLTEDDQLTMSLACKGVKVEYCEAAEFFDGQPVDFKTVFRQRVRRASGRLTAFFRYGFKTFVSIFKYKSFTNYDLFCHYFSYGLFSWIVGLIYPVCSLVYGSINGTYSHTHMLINVSGTFVSLYLSSLFAGIRTALRERKHIHCSVPRTVFYILLYPWFSMISVYIYIGAIFLNVRRLPIPHKDSSGIEDLIPALNIGAPKMKATQKK